MFSVVFFSANQQLIIFNRTGTAVLFQCRGRGMEHRQAAGGVSAARRGGEGRGAPSPRGKSRALPPDPRAPSLAPPDEQIQLLSCHFGSLCCSRVGLNGERAPAGRAGPCCHQEGGSWPSLSHFTLTRLSRLYG